MATPVRGQLQITESDSFFLNSGDMVVKFTGHAPTLSFGEKQATPGAGSAQISGAAPTLKEIAISPSVGSLAFSGKLANPGGITITAGAADSLALTGGLPTRLVNSPVNPSADSLAITETNAARRTGLQFESVAPTLGQDRVAKPGADSLVFSTEPPEAVPTAAVSPGRAELYPIGQSISVSWSIGPAGSDSLALSGQAPTTTFVYYPVVDSLAISSVAPGVVVEVGPPSIIIGVGANEGVVIQNTNATPYWSNTYEICDVSGRKCKPGVLVERWDGLMVHPDHWEPRHPQELLRPTHERGQGATRPDDTNREQYVEDIYPGGVSASDL